ncbi:MAG: hypothetical protein ACREIU_03295 [Planctomycetota bacterium]
MGSSGRDPERRRPDRPDAPPARRSPALLRSALVALGATSAGCTVSDGLEGRDRSAFFQNVRAVWSLRGEGGGSPASCEAAGPPARPRELLALELDFAHARADTDQGLDLDDQIRLDGTIFSGPGDLRADSDFYSGSLALRGGARLAPQVAIEGLGGIAWYRLDLEVRSGGIREGDVFDSAGPMLGVQFTYEPLPALALQARGTTGVGLGADSAGVLTGELGLALEAARGVRILGAWRWWSYDVIPEGVDSEIQLRLSGPAVGLEVRF